MVSKFKGVVIVLLKAAVDRNIQEDTGKSSGSLSLQMCHV